MGAEVWQQVSDAELVAALRKQRDGAADELYRRYWTPIQRFCRNTLHDEDRGEDVAQETFAKLLSENQLPNGELKPWLYRLARNRCLDLLRRHQRSPTDHHRIVTGFDHAKSTAGPRTRLAREEKRRLIREIIDAMPEDYRSVLMLKHFEGLSRAEIAVVLEITEVAVKGRLARASEQLQNELRRITGSGLLS